MNARKRRKSSIGMMAAVLCLCVLLAACSNGNKENVSSDPPGKSSVEAEGTVPATSTEAETGPADPFGKIDPPIEVTAVRSANPWKFEDGDTIEKNGWTELYEKELGIKLKYLWISDQYAQKMNVTMVSGKLPDIMPVDGAQLKQLAEADQLADLTEALEKYGSPELKELLTKDGGIGVDSATFDGKLLALPFLGSYTDSAPLLWIRADWLEKLGLPEPKTMDDVLKIADAFVKQDPDGNNKQDTFGFTINKDLWGDLFSLDGFFNSYHAYPNIWIKDASGNTVYGSIQPEVKTALAKLNELYKSGMLDKEFGVKDAYKVGEAVNGGKIGLTFSTHWLPNFLLGGKELDPEMEWKPFPLKSIDDQVAKPKANYAIQSYYAVRKGMEHPEAAVKMMNAQIHNWDDKYPPSRIRINGNVEKWQYALLINSNPTQNLEAHQNVTKALADNDESVLNKNSGEPFVYASIKKYLADGDIPGWGAYNIFGPTGSQSIYTQYKKDNNYMVTNFIGSPTATMVEKGVTLQKLEMETFTKIIVGESPIDAFDDFVANWKKLGGDQITAEVTEANRK